MLEGALADPGTAWRCPVQTGTGLGWGRVVGPWIGVAVGLAGCGPGAEVPADRVERAGSTASMARSDDRPEIVTLSADTVDGFVAARSVGLNLVARGDASVTEMCITTALRCVDWVPFEAKPTLALPETGAAFTLRAWVRDAEGRISPVQTASVRVDRRPPRAGALSFTPGEAAVTLRWSGYADAGVGALHYRVVGRPGEISPQCERAEALVWEGRDQTVTFTGLGAGTTTFRLCARDALGNGDVGQTIRATPNADVTPPVVDVLQAVPDAPWVGARAIELVAAVSDASAVRRACVTEALPCAAWRDWGGPADPVLPHTLSAGQGEKDVYVVFRDDWGNESAPASLRVGLDTSAPSNGSLSLSALAGAAGLSWSGFGDLGSGVAGYVVLRELDRAPGSCSEGVEVYRGPGLSFVDAGRTGGLRVGYRVCAFDGVGNVSSGATGNVTPLDELDAPVISQITVADCLPAVSDRYVSLDIAASDASGLARMCVSNSPSCSGWRSFQASSMWTLEAGAHGPRSVYVWLEDGLGNRSAAPAVATIDFAPDADRDGYADGFDCDDSDADLTVCTLPACMAEESCAAALAAHPGAQDGAYPIDPGGLAPFFADCAMEEGGWTELQMTDSQQLVMLQAGPTNPWSKCADDAAAPFAHIAGEASVVPDRRIAATTELALSYAQPSTGDVYSEEQMDALRDVFTELHSGTRMVGSVADDDSTASTPVPFHDLWILSDEGRALLLTPGLNGECGGPTPITEWPRAGSQTQTVLWGTDPADLELRGQFTGVSLGDLAPLDPEFLLPDRVRGYVNSGGGVAFGWEDATFLLR